MNRERCMRKVCDIAVEVGLTILLLPVIILFYPQIKRAVLRKIGGTGD